ETYPEKCQIKYKLQGYDESWQHRPYNSMLEYRKLKPGKYSFELLAITPDGSETKPVVFSFRIVPPLWANTYAYMLYVLLIVGSIYALFRYRTRALALQKLALEDTVALRTSELREKQESMMQSIEYASLIQSSILPLEAELHSVIPRHFIIFRPRDGVSGDFYWLHQEEGHFYLALIDCTGHGVPGALIAVTVNSILNSLVKDRGIKEPKDILTLAHQEIGRLLHQQSSYNQQDGFEIALLRVEPDLRKICFAGAKRPLYLYSEDKLLKISANRYAIGGLKWHEKLLFTSTTFSYQPQTRLYLFSDGIVDQPHPAYGRKLGSARWLELLSENAKMPIAEQEQSINNLLQQMLEYSDQRDDITIIGLELP
ncbi:MAG TPA: SpoIIE family protein phosphatase, partial [Candidatus Cloacimonadota bacterium]|nr:SpoIIE family protein phosphatase [Candidatus Cloacimonadota bacterium]